MRAWLAVPLLAIALGSPLAAQEVTTGPRAIAPTVLVLDQERLFEGSLWGKRVVREIEADSAALHDREPPDRGRADGRGTGADRSAQAAPRQRSSAPWPMPSTRSSRSARSGCQGPRSCRLNEIEQQTFLSTAVPVLRRRCCRDARDNRHTRPPCRPDRRRGHRHYRHRDRPDRRGARGRATTRAAAGGKLSGACAGVCELLARPGAQDASRARKTDDRRTRDRGRYPPDPADHSA